MTDWLLSTVWYGSFLAVAVGLVSCVRPLRRLGLSTRLRGVGLIAVAMSAIVANARVTPGPTHVSAPETALDGITPIYQFREWHTQSIDASPERVRAAIKGVSASEIALFRAFTTIRRFGRPGPESILNAPEHQPILDVATRSGFLLLTDTDREVVVGTIVSAPAGYRASIARPDAQWFRTVADAGIVKATMNFHVAPRGTGATVTTETRIFATDDAGLRRFTWYWRTIFPGSWILRVTWLRAIAHRAEA